MQIFDNNIFLCYSAEISAIWLLQMCGPPSWRVLTAGHVPPRASTQLFRSCRDSSNKQSFHSCSFAGLGQKSTKNLLRTETVFRIQIHWFRSGSSILGWIPIRIQGLMKKIAKKFTPEKKLYFFSSKLAIYSSTGLHKGRPSYGRSLQPSKENIQHSKHEISWREISILVGHFCPSGSGSNPDLDLETKHCI